MTAGPALGVDIGGTKIRVTLQDEPGCVTRSVQVPTPGEGGDAIVDAIVRGAALVDAREVSVCGVGTAGDIDAATGRIVWATTTIRNWSGFPLGERLSTRLGVPVVVDNDGNAATYAEATLGAARGAASVIGVFVGTGIGGGVVLDGRVLHGAHHRAGKVGHTEAAGAAGFVCLCGIPGHIEAVSSATAVEIAYAARAGGRRVPYREISRRADAGDEIAIDVLRTAGRRLADWLPSATAIVDPEVVVIGGGAVNAAAYWEAFTERRAEWAGGPTAIDVRLGLLREDAVAIGAAALARWRDRD